MIQHTLNWYNGEIFEAKFILGFGFFLVLIAALFYFIGSTPAAKAIVIPFLTLGILIVLMSVYGIQSNATKMQTLQAQYDSNAIQFQQDEIKRVEGFQYLYPMSIGISLVSFLVALGLLYFVKNIHWQAVAITLIFFGASFAVIDYFSKERAAIYYEQLTARIDDGRK
jgi:membrane-bound ClpP family serine protease